MPALLDFTAYEEATNTVLTDDGQILADSLAASILRWSERYCDRLWAKAAYVEDHDGGTRHLRLKATPVDPTVPPTVSLYGGPTGLYSTFPDSFRLTPDGNLYLPFTPYGGPAMVRVAYTGGYDALPADLRQALTELLVRKFDAANGGGQTLARVSAGSYSEEYVAGGKDIPADTLEVLDSYRRAGVF